MLRRLSLAASLTASACYVYTPLESPGRAPTGTVVHIELSDGGTLAVAPALGTSVIAIEGTVVAATADSLVLALSQVERRREGIREWQGERVTLRRADVREAAERTLSRGRTAGAIGAASAALIGGFWWIRSNKGGGSSGGGTVPPPA